LAITILWVLLLVLYLLIVFFYNKLVTNLIKKNPIKKNKKKKNHKNPQCTHNVFPQNLLVFIVISKLGSRIYILLVYVYSLGGMIISRFHYSFVYYCEWIVQNFLFFKFCPQTFFLGDLVLIENQLFFISYEIVGLKEESPKRKKIPNIDGVP